MPQIRSNYRIVVEPDSPLFGETTEEYCESTVREIKRHIDDLKSVYVDWDMVCSFCGAPWEVASHDDETVKKGQPVCCEKAMDEWDAQNERN